MLMKRLIIICEGQTEQEFCNVLLAPFFSQIGISLQAPLIKKSHGGIVNWDSLKSEIEKYLCCEKDVLLTTLIDYYGIEASHRFPQWNKAQEIVDKCKRLDFIEEAMKNDIDENLCVRFMPYIQLHEFEGLLFNNKEVFYNQIAAEELVGKDELESVFNDFDNPEMINNSVETSPSHRLERIIKGYNKIVYGVCLAEAIGLAQIREKSPRFNRWLDILCAALQK